MRAKGAILGVLGLWLIAAGLIDFGVRANIWNDWIVGVIVGVVGFSLAYRAPGAGIVSGILGFWMIASGFINGVQTGSGARWDDIVIGAIIAIAGYSIVRRRLESVGHIRRAA